MGKNEKTALAVEIIYLLLRGQNMLALKYLALRADQPAPDNLNDAAAAIDALFGAKTMPYEAYWGVVYTYRDLCNGQLSSGSWAESCTRVCDAFSGGGTDGLRALVTELQIEAVDADHLVHVGAELEAVLRRVLR